VCPKKRTPTDDIGFHSEGQIEVEEQHFDKASKDRNSSFVSMRGR